MRKTAHYSGTAINLNDTNKKGGDVNTGDDHMGDEKESFGTAFSRQHLKGRLIR